MHTVIAVEPKALNCWNNFRYLIEKFGFSNGVLIARYPSGWMRLVIEACDAKGVGNVERLKIVEKLRQIKEDRMLNTAYPFDGNEWLDNALKPNVVSQFDALVLEKDGGPENSYSINNVPEELFRDRREKEVLRDAKSLASAASCLFVGTHTIILIDPYLRPNIMCTKLLSAFVDESFVVAKGINKIIIHTAHSNDASTKEFMINEYRTFLGDKFENGLTIQVNRWRNDALDFDFHARYLLTNKAGLRYDRGFVEPADHGDRAKKTDVVCLESVTVMRLLEQFNAQRSPNDLVDVIDII